MMVYVILLSAVSVIFRIIFRYSYEGKEYIQPYKKNGRPFVVCANHISMLDPIFVVMAYGCGKKMTIMGKAELFKNPIFAWLFKQVGVFPVERGTGDKTAVENAIADVKNGHGMLICPEGTRTKGDEMIKMKSGAFMVAAQTGADIIPVRMIYPTKDRSLHFFSRVVVKFGEPLLAEDLNLTGGSKQALRAAKETLQESLDGLLKEYNTKTGYIPPIKLKAEDETSEIVGEKSTGTSSESASVPSDDKSTHKPVEKTEG
ncbi:MAG: lysophospholipid acyltransferase family protein [Oscillospiraceae bacterium]